MAYGIWRAIKRALRERTIAQMLILPPLIFWRVTKMDSKNLIVDSEL